MATATKASAASRDLAAELIFLTRALKAPTLRESRLAGWPSGHEPNPGATRSIWPPVCNAKSPLATPTAAKAA
jgi:hypothetical protein